jgi:hypothetical protein
MNLLADEFARQMTIAFLCVFIGGIWVGYWLCFAFHASGKKL